MNQPALEYSAYFAQNLAGPHCKTCSCSQHANFMSRVSNPENLHSNLRLSMVQSRVVPMGDPATKEVGEGVIPNRTVWFKSTSPRPNRISIKVSSPDRPNLRPSQVSGPTIKRMSSIPDLHSPVLQSRASTESLTMTPIRQINEQMPYENQQFYSPAVTSRP